MKYVAGFGWAVKPLGDLVDVLDRLRKPITKKDRKEGAYPYYGATGVLDHVDGYLFDEPLVLIGEDGAKWEAGATSAFAIEGKTWVNNHAHVVRPHRDRVLDDWLIYYLNGADLMPFISGMTVPKLNQGRLREIPIPLPPLEEQQRIVVVLDEAFEGLARARAHAEANLKDLNELVDSQFDLAVSGSFCGPAPTDDLVKHFLDEVAEKRKTKKGAKDFSLPDDFDDARPLRDGWQWVPLGNLSSKISDGVHKTPKYVEQGIPFITVKNLTAAPGISFAETKFITESDHREFIKRTHPEKGDILISKDGTIGVVRKIDTDRIFSIFVSVALVKPIDVQLSDYLTIALQARSVQEQIVPKGAALKHLYLNDLRRLPIPIGPLPDLKRTVSRMGEVAQDLQQLEIALSQKLQDLDDLRQSLLQKAFAGELT